MLFRSVTIPDGTPVVSNTVVTPVSCFGGNDGSISITPSFPSSAQFNWNTGATTDSVGGLTAGNYSVIVSDARPCFDTLQFNITQPTDIVLALSSLPETSTGTQNGIAMVSTTGGTLPYSFLWNDPLSQIDSIASGLASGMYSVVVTDNNGCSKTDSVLVDITTQINEINSVGLTKLFPNPAIGNSTLTITGNLMHAKLELLDCHGKILQTHQLENDSTFTLERKNIADGFYFCKISFIDHIEIIPVIWN